MSTITDQVVERAARAMYDSIGGDLVAPTCPAYIDDARAALNAVVPELLQEERDRIADAIEAMRTYTCCGNFAPDYCETCRVTLACAAIARTGGKDTTPAGPTNPEDSP